jgi:hypothetical protein
MAVETVTLHTVPQKNAYSLPRISDHVQDLWLDPDRWLHAPARAWLERTLQAASSRPRRSLTEALPERRSLDDLLAKLYRRDGARGPVPFPPDPTALYLAWRARRLIAQGFATEDAFSSLVAKFGPAAKLPGRPDRALAKLDDLIRRIRRQDGWSVPAWLELSTTPQANAPRREERRAAQRKMLTRIGWLAASLRTSDQSALLDVALHDPRMCAIADSVVSTFKRHRGRPRKGSGPTPLDPSARDNEITEAVVRYGFARGG